MEINHKPEINSWWESYILLLIYRKILRENERHAVLLSTEHGCTETAQRVFFFKAPSMCNKPNEIAV
jgi:hypothetical protein